MKIINERIKIEWHMIVFDLLADPLFACLCHDDLCDAFHALIEFVNSLS